MIYDKTTGRSRGFGFVTMSSVEEVEAAAQQFNGYVSMTACLVIYVRLKTSFSNMLTPSIDLVLFNITLYFSTFNTY